MTKKRRENAYSKFKPMALAISVCVLAHAFLFFLFSPIKQIMPIKYGIPSPKTIMLPLNDKHVSNSIKEIIEWMNLENPTVIVNPDNELGYSKLVYLGMHIPEELASKNLVDIITILSVFPKNITVSKIANIPITIENYFRYFAYYPTSHFNQKIEKTTSPSSSIYPKVTELYRHFDLPITFNLNTVSQDDIRNLKQGAITVIMLHYPKDQTLFPFANIVKSCGDLQLDSLALNTIIPQKLPQSVEDKFSGQTVFLKVEWAPTLNYIKK